MATPLDQTTASGRRRWNDRCGTSRCLHPFCSLGWWWAFVIAIRCL